MIKIKRSGGFIELEIGEFVACLTHEQANKLGNYLISISNPHILEITLEPDQFRDVSEDGEVGEPTKQTLVMPSMLREANIKPE